jgi:hypothetical protein
VLNAVMLIVILLNIMGLSNSMLSVIMLSAVC